MIGFCVKDKTKGCSFAFREDGWKGGLGKIPIVLHENKREGDGMALSVPRHVSASVEDS